MKSNPKDRCRDSVPGKTRRQFLTILSRSLLGISAYLSTSASSGNGEMLEFTQPKKNLQHENTYFIKDGWVLTKADIKQLGLHPGDLTLIN